MICLKCIQKEPELRIASAAPSPPTWKHICTARRCRCIRPACSASFNRTFRETPHAVVMENFGFAMDVAQRDRSAHVRPDDGLACGEVKNPLWYLLPVGRRTDCLGRDLLAVARNAPGRCCSSNGKWRMCGEAAIAATIGVFVIEYLLGEEVLSLSPMLAVIAGVTFAVKAGMLSGLFYFCGGRRVCHRRADVPAALLPALRHPPVRSRDRGVLLRAGVEISSPTHARHNNGAEPSRCPTESYSVLYVTPLAHVGSIVTFNPLLANCSTYNSARSR